jgi:hypothetical protein
MRRLLTALALIVSAATAFADEVGERTFTVEFGGRDEALREDCSRRLSAWWEEIVAPDRTPAGWDEKKLGPWSLVVRTSGAGFVEEKPGLVHVVLSVDTEGIPSRKDAADAFAAAVLAGLRERVGLRAAALSDGADAGLKVAQVDVRLQIETVEQKRATLEASHGGPPDARAEALAARRADVDRDVAETRIQLAVAAKKLETARAAAERAVAIERLRRDAEDLQRRVEAGSAADQTAARDALAAVLLKIDDLSKTTPTLDTARETAFQIEVERVGLEARATVLAQERGALDASLRDVRRDVVRWAALQRELDAATSRRDEVEQRLADAARAAAKRGPVFEVIRAPGPPSKEEKKR